MALLQLLSNAVHDSRRYFDDIYDQHFGLGLRELDSFNVPALRAGYLRPWRHLAQADSGVSSIKADGNEFSIQLDVNHFKPEELKVKLENGYIIVEGKHEERGDEHGFISRQFVRRYKLPADVLQDSLASNLSSDGVLTLKATKKPKETNSGREIYIVRTNKPALIEEQGTKEDIKKKEQPKEINQK